MFQYFKNNFKKYRRDYMKIVISLFILLFYYLIVRHFLMSTMATVPIELLLAGVILIFLIIFLIRLIISLIIFLIFRIRLKNDKKVSRWKYRLLLSTKKFILSLFFLFILTVLSQLTTYTPPIKGENSIATIEKVNLNHSVQYITIRGKNKDNPVILFLAGGPGGTQLAATRDVLKGLEKNFVVVNWDQPGSGKSFSAVPINQLTPNRYISDGHALTKYLKKRFHQDKIYIVGQSWGSALGVWLSQKYPEDYKAFIGVGQMVSFLETEKYCYNLALETAKEKSDISTYDKLIKQGPPPYTTNVTMKSSTYLMYLFNVMANNPNINKTNHNTFKDISGPEYGLYDKVNYLRALVITFDHVYPQLYGVDLRDNATDFKIPVYILHGKYDVNAPVDLVEDYYDQIDAPSKQLIWFSHSGHDLWIDESNLFVQTMNQILLETSE